MYSTRHSGTGVDDRAASALVGLVLLFGLVFAGAGIIYWAGMDAKQSVQTASEVDTAETTLQEASTKLSTLSFKGNGSVTSFDLSGKDPSDVTIEDQGSIRFQINRNSTCTHEIGLGSIVYSGEGRDTVAYQAGGVFTKTESGVAIVQSPSMTYRSETVDGETIQTIRFPVVNVSGEVDTSASVTARATQKESNELGENLCIGGSNSTVDRVQTLTITIANSPYYEAWEQYLDEQFEPHVLDKNVDDATQTISYTVPLGRDTTTDQFTVENADVRAAVWSAGTTELEFVGSPSGSIDSTKVDSYDSESAPYTVASGSQAVVVNNGSLTVRQDAQILGNVNADGDVTVKGNNAANPTRVDGNIAHNGTYQTTGNSNAYEVTGSVEGDFGFVESGVVSPDSEIQDAIAASKTKNDNDDTPVLDASGTDGVVQSGIVESGVYYVEDFAVDSGESITFNTSAGDVVVAVDGDVDVDARIEVRGDNQVRLFVKGDVTVSDEVKVYGTASTPTNESSRLHTYVHSGHDVTFEPGSRYTGVLYAPSKADDVTLESSMPGSYAEVYGAIVGGKVSVEKGTKVHFDTAVQTSDPTSADDTVGGSPDTDHDDVPDSYDDCPDGDSSDTGVNGCQGVTEDEDANALVVNQSRARITVAGTMVADEKTVTREVGEREPLDVVFVIDDSGSMGNPEINQISSYDYPVTGSTDNWTPWETPEEASYVDEDDHDYGWDYVPSGQQWEVIYQYPNWMDPDREILYPGNRGDFVADGGPGDDPDPVSLVRRRNTTSEQTYTVSSGEIWLVSDEPEPDESEISDPSVDTKWFRAGESFSSDNWNYYERYEIGNDPDDQREGAMQTFIGLLNESNGDRVGVVSFTTANDGNTDVMWDISSYGDEFDNANSSLDLYSSGGTPMEDAIEDASDELQSGDNDEKVMVLLTDGRPDGDEDDVVEAAEDVPDGIQIQTVGLGGNTDTDLLKQIATETGGDYSSVGDSDQLNETFRKIAGSVTKEEINIIEYKNTTVEVDVGGTSVTLFGNANTPTNDSRPSKVIDIADLQGANHDELEKYVGTLVSARAMTRSCDGNTTFDTTTGPGGDTYSEVTCNATSGTFDDVDNSNDATHKIYVDGESLPSSSEFEAGWFKEESFGDVIAEYESDTGKTLVDDATNEFDLGENDAVIIVKTNSSDGDTDYVVLHFEAYDTAVDYNTSSPSATPSDDSDSASTSNNTGNGYVIEIGENNVNVSSGNPSLEPLPASVTVPNDRFDAISGAGTAVGVAADVRD